MTVLANTVTFLSLYTTISTSVPVNTELSGHAKPKLLTNTMREYVDSGEYVSVNTVRGLRNWRGNMHRRAEGPEVRIAPSISKTEDCIHDASEPESMHSHCVGKTIW